VDLLKRGAIRIDPKASFGGVFSDASAANQRIRLLWLGCGTEDRLYGAGKSVHEALTAAGIRHVWIEGPGSHEWQVWRKHLHDLAPRLF
jgi:enterochelin esterase family protein